MNILICGNGNIGKHISEEFKPSSMINISRLMTTPKSWKNITTPALSAYRLKCSRTEVRTQRKSLT